MGHPVDKNGHKKILNGGKAVIGSSHVTTIGAEDKKPHQVEVRPPSGRDRKPCCVTHGEVFDTEKQFRAHLDADKNGAHVTAYWCAEEVEEPRGVDGFGNPVIYRGPYGLESDREIEHG